MLCRVLGYGYEHLGDTPRFLDSYCYYYDENSNTKDYALTAAQAGQVYAALMQDVQDSDNGSSDIFAVQEHLYDSPIFFWLELYFESTNEKGRPVVYSLGPNVNNSTPNTLQVLNELLPELKSNTVTPPSDDGTSAIPANGRPHRPARPPTRAPRRNHPPDRKGDIPPPDRTQGAAPHLCATPRHPLLRPAGRRGVSAPETP